MTLHNLEKKILIALKKRNEQSTSELMKNTQLDEASVNHASAWLMSKNLVQIEEEVKKEIELGSEGKKYLENGLPERKALNLLEGKELSVAEARKKMGSEADIAINWLIRQGIIKIDNGIIKVTDTAKKYIKEKMPQEIAIENISHRTPISEDLEKQLVKRGNLLIIREIKTRKIKLTPEGQKEAQGKLEVVDEVSQITPEMLKTGSWKTAILRKYDTTMPVERKYFGKRHPVSQAVAYAKKIWLEMGFKEMRGPLVDSEFWVFDSLFVPQDHPAREMQDTLFIDGTGKIDEKLLNKVKKAHEDGVDGSQGWGYKFSKEISERLMMRTHTTCLSAHTLAELKKSDWPAKFFAVGRCFRNETIDWKHGFEFNQSEGIVVDPNANFRHLLGYLKQFYTKLGHPNIRFKPKYFPYTEMSIVVEDFHKEKKVWYELGGAGIFRPEVTEPLLGEPVPVLAWGPGMDRLFMEYYKFEKFNEVYKNDIQRLRDLPQWSV